MKPFLQILLAFCIFFISCSGDCDLGYEGPDCNIEVREKFIGSWTATNYECDLANSTTEFTFDLSTGDDINEVTVRTPNTPDLLLLATVEGTTITILPQEFVFGIAVTYAGQGSIIGDDLELVITRTSDGLVSTCTGTYNK